MFELDKFVTINFTASDICLMVMNKEAGVLEKLFLLNQLIKNTTSKEIESFCESFPEAYGEHQALIDGFRMLIDERSAG